MWEQAVFENINFEVNRGEVFCLIGSKGCGKATLLDCVLGILSLRDSSIFLDGKNIKGTASQDVARQVAYAPQVYERTFPPYILETS